MRRNRVQCRRCLDVIESLSRHDFRICSCGAVFVDGGQDYFRWGGWVEDIKPLTEDDDV